jgi:hypothetical protein
MNLVLHIRLQTSPAQHARLLELQAVFAQVCNALAPLVQQTACWNRVALHHLAYRSMRQQFPALGSQMICNALYSVSRASRWVYQHPASPFNLSRLAGRPLPRLHFLPQSPVYFDRHTLSLRDGVASMYTLDGRMRFNLPLAPADEQRFRTARLREIVLQRRDGQFQLSFTFGDGAPFSAGLPSLPDLDAAPGLDAQAAADAGELPHYLLVLDGADASSAPALGAPALSTPAAPHYTRSPM